MNIRVSAFVGVDTLKLSLTTGEGRVKPVPPVSDEAGSPWRGRIAATRPRLDRAIASALADGSASGAAGGYLLRGDALSHMPEDEANALGLPAPASAPFVFRLCRTASGHAMSVEIRRPGDLRGAAVNGGLVRFPDGTAGRAIAPLVAAIRAASAENPVQAFAATTDRSFVDVLMSGTAVSIFQATAFGIDVWAGEGDPEPVPVLFAHPEDPMPVLPEGQRAVAANALAAKAASSFQRTGIASGIFVDEEVAKACAYVASATGEERLALLRDPEQVLRSRGIALDRFVKVAGFGAQVAGIGQWSKPRLDFLSAASEAWIPEEFVVAVDDETFVLDGSDVESIRAQLAKRVASVQIIEVQGRLLPRSKAEELIRGVEAQIQSVTPASGVSPMPAKRGGIVTVLARDNFESVAVRSRFRPREDDGRAAPGVGITTAMKPHQVQAAEWLAERWRSGAPGALLADEMGLGKSLELLAFIAWLKSGDCGPVLVVAPANNVGTWKTEIEKHVADGALGTVHAAVGESLRGTGGAVSAMRQAGVVITSYETLAQNAVVFAALRWSFVAFDEIQKIKDPSVFARNGACAIDADFTAGATGTPVENRIEDLWSVVDCVERGRLGDLRSFSREHADLAEDKLAAVTASLVGPDLSIGPDGAPFMLRRLKEDVLEGLPTKLVERHRIAMPEPQAAAYAKVLQEAKEALANNGEAAALKCVARLRAVSLHPDGPGDVDVRSARSLGEWARRSARTVSLLETLDSVKAAGEKALVFLDDLAMQRVVAAAAATLFGMSKDAPRIYGQVPSSTRAAIADAFQSSPDGFDFLILSPRAAATGTTLTAANHVVHASRWWNPAIEDQASDRVHRIGQDKDVTVHLPMAIHPALGSLSFDVVLDGLQERKRILRRKLIVPPVTGREAKEIFSSVIEGVPLAA